MTRAYLILSFLLLPLDAAERHSHPTEEGETEGRADFIEKNSSIDSQARESFTARSSMKNSKIIFTREQVGRVAFLGGSITYNPGWRPRLCKTIQERFPETKFDFVAAGIPSFGSTPHAFRFQRDVWARGQFAQSRPRSYGADRCRGVYVGWEFQEPASLSLWARSLPCFDEADARIGLVHSVGSG